MIESGQNRQRLVKTIMLLVPVAGVGLAIGFGASHWRDLIASAPGPVEVPTWYPSDRPELPDSSLRFVAGVGEFFPDGDFTYEDGSAGRFSDFFDGTPTVLLFWHFGCKACLDQAALWNEHMAPVLTGDVKQVAVLDKDDRATLQRLKGFVAGKTVVFVDWERIKATHHVLVAPTIVSMEGRGIVTHIQYESSAAFDFEFVLLLTGIPMGP